MIEPRTQLQIPRRGVVNFHPFKVASHLASDNIPHCNTGVYTLQGCLGMRELCGHELSGWIVCCYSTVTFSTVIRSGADRSNQPQKVVSKNKVTAPSGQKKQDTGLTWKKIAISMLLPSENDIFQ